MRSAEFWDYFNKVARPRLARRADSFARIFEYLDRLGHPVEIVETGCVRQIDNWSGDGQSTVLFDKYAECHPGSTLLSVDADPAAVATCKSLVTHAQIHTGDSIAFLEGLVRQTSPKLGSLDLLYLDSYDVNLDDPLPSANHHLNELLAIAPLLRPDTLVVVDDSPMFVLGVPSADGRIAPIQSPAIGGKGRSIARHAASVGAEVYFYGYQCAWFGFGRSSGDSAKPRPLDSGSALRSQVEAAMGSPAPVTAHHDSDRGVTSARNRDSPRDSLARIEPAALAMRMAEALSRPDRARLIWRLLETESEEVKFNRHSTWWTGLTWDHVISENLFVHGGFQEAEVRAILRWLKNCGLLSARRNVVIDVGANLGTFTIPFAQQSDCRIIAVEPVPELFDVLRRNVAANGLDSRVTCVHAAICAADVERVRLIVPNGNSGAAEVCRDGSSPSWTDLYSVRSVVEAPTKTLAHLIRELEIEPRSIALVWSDTQGCEADVINTGAELWRSGVPLFVEFAPRFFPEATRQLVEIANQHFSQFIPAANLITDAGATAYPVVELEAFSNALGPDGSDALLLPESLDPSTIATLRVK